MSATRAPNSTEAAEISAASAASGFASAARPDGGFQTQPMTPEEFTPTAAIATQTGNYRLLRKLGQGGMGAVYLAERADGEFEQLVALKTLLPIYGKSPTTLARLLSERQILARLNHPNIAGLLDGGTDSRGIPFIVMEYVDGERIDQHCESRHLDLRARIRLFIKICDAITCAHQALIVHRDIKPDNILVDQRGEPKLLDFGIAKVLSDDPAFAGQVQTQTGFAPMTQRYASPEQIRGETAATASDIYALAVVLYELLSGSSPYREEDLFGLKIIAAILDYDPPPPSKRRIGKPGNQDAALWTDVDAILLKALRKNPADRYASVAQFSEDLKRALRGSPVDALIGSQRYRVHRYARKNWLMLTALSLAFGLMAFGILHFKNQRDSTADKLKVAARERNAARKTTLFLSDLFSRIDPTRVQDPVTSARALLDEGSERLEQDFAEQPEVRFGLMLTLGEIYLNLNEARRASELLGAIDSARSGFSSAEQDRFALVMGKLAWLSGDYAGARARLAKPQFKFLSRERARLGLLFEIERASNNEVDAKIWLQRLADITRPENPTQARALRESTALFDLQFEQAPRCVHALTQKDSNLSLLGPAREIDALKLLARCQLAATRPLDAGAARFPWDHDALSLLANTNGAMRSTQSALDIAAQFAGKDSALYGSALTIRAEVQASAGDFMAAETAIDQALALAREKFGNMHFQYAQVLISKAKIMLLERRFEAALQLNNEALSILNASSAPNAQLRTEVHQRNALALGALGQFEASALELESARTLAQRLHPAVSAALELSLGTIYCDSLQRFDAGKKLLNQAAQRYAALDSRANLMSGNALMALGACFAQHGKLQEAKATIGQSMPIFLAALGANHLQTRKARHYLASLDDALNKGDAKVLLR